MIVGEYLRCTEMAKFSVFREGEDEDDDDELFLASTPEPETKRRRISGSGSPSTSSQSTREEGSLLSSESNQSIVEKRNNIDMDGQFSVILSNPDVLDCPICFDPLTIPVYQCLNGHIACSSCCTNLSNKCPSCCEKIGHSRCRAIENVLESVKISCIYKIHGCQAKVSYCSKLSHEGTCAYAPYECPFLDCTFRCSPRNLPGHLNQEHNSSVISICYNLFRSVHVKWDDKFVILQEEKDGIWFILNIKNNSMTIKCISCTDSGDYSFAYALVLRKGSSTVRFESLTEKASQGQGDDSSVGFLQVPNYFFNVNGFLWLDICVWSKDASHADTSKAVCDVHTTELGNNAVVLL